MHWAATAAGELGRGHDEQLHALLVQHVVGDGVALVDADLARGDGQRVGAVVPLLAGSRDRVAATAGDELHGVDAERRSEHVLERIGGLGDVDLAGVLARGELVHLEGAHDGGMDGELVDVDLREHGVEVSDEIAGRAAGIMKERATFITDLWDLTSYFFIAPHEYDEKQVKKDEIMADFALKSERVHTINQLLKAYAMFEKDVDYVIMDNKVKIVDEQTGRIMEGRRWSDGLHQAVEAKENVKVEAATQTFATITLQNYFRMYHKLAGMTGTAETEAGEFWSIYKLDVVVIPTNRPIARIDNNDLIYKTKKAKYEAVINKIVELTSQGRPVLVGTTDVETSELLSRMLKLRGIQHQVLNAKQHAREAEVVAQAGQRSTVTIATNMAGRGTDIKLSDEVRKAGGLAIIGTERHDSRRVDRQLRGRAGRQGDPGSSTFYVSLEDKLMRLFGSERIASVVDKMGMEDDEALENSMLSSSIERAQKKVEENNFGIRKRLLEYDDVMNSQREVIYTRRRNALSGERVEIDVMNMMQDMAEIMVESCEGYDYDSFAEHVMMSLSIDTGFDAGFYDKAKKQEIIDRLFQNMLDVYKRRMETMVQKAWPVIKDVFEKQGAIYQNIAIPISDGRKMLTLSVNLKKAYETEGKEIARSLTKAITLYQIDEHWKEHLRDMDDLKQSVQNATYEQKDPLLIYKFESFNLFKNMLESLSKDILSFLFRAQIPLREAAPAQTPAPQRKPDMSQMRTSRTDLVTNGGEQKSRMPMHAEKTVGRNDPCPCGSGKKYKNCHGRNL